MGREWTRRRPFQLFLSLTSSKLFRDFSCRGAKEPSFFLPIVDSESRRGLLKAGHLGIREAPNPSIFASVSHLHTRHHEWCRLCQSYKLRKDGSTRGLKLNASSVITLIWLTVVLYGAADAGM